HDGDAITQVLHDLQIVRDEQVRQLALALQLDEQIDDLRLDRDVERAQRLVGDDEARLDRERARDADALALAAGELVRIARRDLGAQADDVEQFGDALFARGGVAEAVDDERLVEDVADGHARIERRVRILEDDLRALAERAQRARR